MRIVFVLLFNGKNVIRQITYLFVITIIIIVDWISGLFLHQPILFICILLLRLYSSNRSAAWMVARVRATTQAIKKTYGHEMENNNNTRVTRIELRAFATDERTRFLWWNNFIFVWIRRKQRRKQTISREKKMNERQYHRHHHHHHNLRNMVSYESPKSNTNNVIRSTKLINLNWSEEKMPFNIWLEKRTFHFTNR